MVAQMGLWWDPWYLSEPSTLLYSSPESLGNPSPLFTVLVENQDSVTKCFLFIYL